MPRKNYNTDGPNAEDRAWAAFTGMMIQHIKEIQKDWKKPWFSETASKWPKNMSGREYNGMNAIMLMLQSEKQGYTTPVLVKSEQAHPLGDGKNPFTGGQK